MTRRAKRMLLIVDSVVACVILAFIGLVASVLYSFDQAFKAHEYPHRSDADMVQTFHEHHAEFEEVRSMVVSDGVVQRVDENWSIPANIDPVILAKYRELFATIKTPGGINTYPGSGRIDFIASSLGWVASGSSKGYVYDEGKPRGIFVDSLDDPEVLNSLARYVKRIDGNWYLYFER